MAILTHDCPRCGGNRLGFTYLSEVEIDPSTTKYGVFFKCPKCHHPITVLLRNQSSRHIYQFDGDIRDARPHGVYINEIEPPAPVPSAPEHTPDAVAACYVEALENLYQQRWTSAASMLRRCLEIALKEFAPDIDAWKLEKRIDKLAAENLITPALKEWAHELRLDGNEALHGTEPATEELATRMERLTHFLLTYLYTLPAQVAQARAERENGD